jgi:hypothetical protein
MNKEELEEIRFKEGMNLRRKIETYVIKEMDNMKGVYGQLKFVISRDALANVLIHYLSFYTDEEIDELLNDIKNSTKKYKKDFLENRKTQ